MQDHVTTATTRAPGQPVITPTSTVDHPRRSNGRGAALSVLLPFDMAVVAVVVAVTLRDAAWIDAGLITAMGALAAAVLLLVLGCYDADIWSHEGYVRILGRLALCTASALWLVGMATRGLDIETRGYEVVFGAVAIPLAQLGARVLFDRRLRRSERVLVLGGGAVADLVARLTAGNRKHWDIRGYVDDTPNVQGLAHLGLIEDAGDVIMAERIDRVVVAFSHRPDGEVVEWLRHCEATGVTVDIVPRLFDIVGVDPQFTTLGQLPLMTIQGHRAHAVERAVKRASDVAGALALLTLLAPVFAVVAAAIALDDGRPVLFRQTRIGRHGRPFRIVKFRTMSRGADDKMVRLIEERSASHITELTEQIKQASPNHVTRVGGFLRSSSLDELPQLCNVLLGHMSFVGPRPLQSYEVDALSGWQLARLDVRPGITGLWQVMGRSDLPWDERLHLDYCYVRDWRMSSDISIAVRTLPSVVARRGAI